MSRLILTTGAAHGMPLRRELCPVCSPGESNGTIISQSVTRFRAGVRLSGHGWFGNHERDGLPGPSSDLSPDQVRSVVGWAFAQATIEAEKRLNRSGALSSFLGSVSWDGCGTEVQGL